MEGKRDTKMGGRKEKRKREEGMPKTGKRKGEKMEQRIYYRSRLN